MGLRAFLIILAIFGIFGMDKGFSSRSSPLCSTKSIKRMIQAQHDQVMAKRDFLSNLAANPDLLYDEANQQSVVTLTSEQKRQILRNYPNIFTGREEFAEASRTVGTISMPLRQAEADGDDGTFPQSLAPNYNRVCEPKLGTKTIRLVRDTNGNIVQLVQLDDQNKNQWIFEETCKMSMDGDATCGLAVRIVPALFINLAGIIEDGGDASDFDFAEVIIQCCVAVRAHFVP